MTEEIKGKVAQIVDDYRIVLNKGTNAGVEVGSRFAVLSAETVPITDPDNSEKSIGELLVARTIVKVVNVGGDYSIAQTFRTAKSSGLFPSFSVGPSEHKDSIQSDSLTVAERLGAKERSVHVGDEVIEIPGNEDFAGIVLPF